MASTTLAAALSASATSITVPVDDALGAFPVPQFPAWIGTEQVLVTAGPPDSGSWSIVRDQSAAGALFIDVFDREVASGWGTGWVRAYGLTATVSGGVGTITPPVDGGVRPYQSALTVLDSEVRFSFTGNEWASSQIHVGAHFRENGLTIALGGGSYYRMNCSVRASDQLMRLRGESSIAGFESNLDGIATSTGLIYAPGTVYWLAARCSGVSPTTLEGKLWVDGTAEPAAWTRTDTDSTLGPQVAGYPGVRGHLDAGWTGGTLVISYDDFSVLPLPVGTAWPAGIAVQTIDLVDTASLIPVGSGPPITQPPDGARYLDRTNKRLYARTLGNWYYVTMTRDVALNAALTGQGTLAATLT